jgi:hypothetical protein
MIREFALNQLSEEFGAPEVNPRSHWWTVGIRRPYPVHICLNETARVDEAHVLVYDPKQVEGVHVIDVHDLLARIRRIVEANGVEKTRF